MAKTRIYCVRVTHPNEEEVRLVEAMSPRAAISHVSNGLIDVSVPSVQEAVALVTQGVNVEMAGVETTVEGPSDE